jgi:SAM-dependent methyltransferase
LNIVDWNARYVIGDTPWEKGGPAPPLAEYLDSNEVKGRVLVPGCGLGHDVRLLARADCTPIGFDLSQCALNQAQSFPKVGKEKYVLGNYFEPPDNYLEAFDWIFEHTFFCAFDPSLRRDYVTRTHSLLKTRCYFLAVFFVEIEDPEGPPFPVSTKEIDQLFGDRFETVKAWVPTRAYEGRELLEEMRVMRKLS